MHTEVKRPRRGLLRAALIGGALAGAALTGTAQANPTPVGPGPYFVDWTSRHQRSAEPDASEFKLINYFFTRATATNMVADPAGLRGVSLGPIGIGEAGSATSVKDDTALYIEQRWIPVISYSPNFVDGYATFRAQFEIDYTWGQAANQIQNNQGGGLNADQVNIQTKNVNVGLYPTRNPLELSILIGTQSVYDSIYDPTITSLTHITRTGYKLTFLGTDGTGASAFGHFGDHYFKAMYLPIGAAQAKKASDNDARLYYVHMGSLDYAQEVMPGTIVGLTLMILKDNTEGRAFAFEGLVPSGPSSTGLYSYTGTPRFRIRQPTGTVGYLGMHFHHNIDFKTGPFGASGFVMYNGGKYESQEDNTQLNEEIDIAGYAANLELMYNHGKTNDDVFTAEFMYTNGDEDTGDDEYSGVFTLNNYGLPGAVWFNHKTLLLFPFTSTVSNYTGGVTDISNQGYGLQTAIVTAQKDLIPYRLNLKVGGAIARSSVSPKPVQIDGNEDGDVEDPEDVIIERGRTIGAEVNVELKYHLKYLMTFGLHGGYMFTGNFYNANEQVDGNAWAAFSTFTWYGF